MTGASACDFENLEFYFYYFRGAVLVLCWCLELHSAAAAAGCGDQRWLERGASAVLRPSTNAGTGEKGTSSSEQEQHHVSNVPTHTLVHTNLHSCSFRLEKIVVRRNQRKHPNLSTAVALSPKNTSIAQTKHSFILRKKSMHPSTRCKFRCTQCRQNK